MPYLIFGENFANIWRKNGNFQKLIRNGIQSLPPGTGLWWFLVRFSRDEVAIMSVLGRILFTGEVEAITQFLNWSARFESIHSLETSIPCQYDFQNINMAAWKEVGKQVRTYNWTKHNNCTAGSSNQVPLCLYWDQKKPMGQLLSEVYCRIQLSVSLSFCIYLLSISENQKDMNKIKILQISQMDQIKSRNLSNCELVYSDSDLSSAHAVVFHLHKVHKYCSSS